MKLHVSSLRRLIRESMLLESTCPLCGSEGAYVGFSEVDCPNPNCTAYSKTQSEEMYNKAKLAADELINREHHDVDLPNVEIWLGATGNWILDVPDNTERGVVRYEWINNKWERWDFEPYYDDEDDQ